MWLISFVIVIAKSGKHFVHTDYPDFCARLYEQSHKEAHFIRINVFYVSRTNNHKPRSKELVALYQALYTFLRLVLYFIKRAHCQYYKQAPITRRLRDLSQITTADNPI